MNPTAVRPRMDRGFWVLWLVLTAGLVLPARAGDKDRPAKYQAQLIWGTNGQKPDKPLKEVSPQVQECLGRIFKWMNYWEVAEKTVEVRPDSTASVEMSDECRLEIRRFPGHEVEVQFFGKGRQVFTQKQKLPPGEKLIVGGDSKKENAWFVVVTAAPKEKSGGAK
ncbi:MAG: hypothetical protein ACKVYV_06465 [Limisphaerales bacterium]